MTKGLISALVIETVILAALLTIAADQIAHARVEKLGGVNVWGYRGAVLHQKQSNEVRIAVTGGDLAFGWGVAASETLAPSIRRLVSLQLDRPGHPARIVSGVTTAAQGLPPVDYAAWITHGAYLRPDVICLLPDPIGHALSDSRFLPDRRSAAFATFGYSAILPLVLQEKGTVTHSAALRIAGRTLATLDAAARPRAAGVTVTGGTAYAVAIASAVRAGLRASTAGVVVVLAPAADDGGVKQMVGSTFAEERVRLVDLGADPRMLDEALRLDGFSFSTGGHGVAAESVAPAVLELIGHAERRTP